MNKVTTQVAGVVAAVAIFALLSAVGYLTQVGLSQTFGPSLPDGNLPRRNQALDNGIGDGSEATPIPEDESVWEDYDMDSFKNKTRLEVRPGNFEVIKKVGEFFESIYAVEPDYPDIAFPFNDNGSRIETVEEWDKADADWQKKQRESGEKQQNKFRTYNFAVHKLTFLDFGEGESAIENAKDYGIGDRTLQRFQSVRQDHEERCCLVLIRAGLESLQSDKIEGDRDDSDFILCYVMKADGWKLVWFEK